MPCPTCSGPISTSSSAASTRVTCRRRRVLTSPTRETTSGGCSTRGVHAAVLRPDEQFELLPLGIGVTNAARRATRGLAISAPATSRARRARLEAIARELEPHVIAFVGKEAYRGAFGERPALGAQERRLGDTALFVLPSTSPAMRRCRGRNGCAGSARCDA